MSSVAAYGSWRSPISAEVLVAGRVGLGGVTGSAGRLYWREARSAEGGRIVVVRRAADGSRTDVFGPGWNARTTVHEYGGGASLIDGDTVWFSNFDDQRVYRVDDGAEPRPVTPEPPTRWAYRYADYVRHPDGAWLVGVRETHRGPSSTEVDNELVVIPADGAGEPRVIASGHDFYGAPRLSPDGRTLVWITWDHPDMPWDTTRLWRAEFRADGTLGEPRAIAGGSDESVIEPLWRADGVLHFVSDRTGWWNVYRYDESADGEGTATPVTPVDAEIGGPAWALGQRSYAFLPDGLVAVAVRNGASELLVARDGALTRVDTGFSEFSGPYVPEDETGVVYTIGASSTDDAVIARIEPATGAVTAIARAADTPFDPGYVSVPRAIEFPTEGGLTAHALYYPPTNQDVTGPEGELPPLIVFNHGGPTAATDRALKPGIQYFTSRGLAVVDVDYGGSTGYGRPYRERLRGQWGVVDVADCANAARYLADQGLVDSERLAIRGGSAGGYTTLSALTFTDVFACGASHFGVADAGALARDTHKFESRYLDRLIGPYPEARDRYEERSPIFHVDQLRAPVIFFQGLEDQVVPPAQAEEMTAALAAKGVPYAYLPFEGEQHGFRRSANIVRCAEAELAFYGYVFGFDPADATEPITLHTAAGAVTTRAAGR